MDQYEFQRRTKALALSAIALAGGLPAGRASDVIGRQLPRSATSVGANYRAACRSRSSQEMIAKLAIVEEEADECLHWLELLNESHLVSPDTTRPLTKEASEILAMVRRIEANAEGTNRLQSTIDNRKSAIAL